MIQPVTTMSDALTRGLYNLGGIGTAVRDARDQESRLASEDVNRQQAKVTLAGEMRKRQLQDAMDALAKNKTASQTSMGSNGKAGLGMDASGMPTGLQGAGADASGLDDGYANLMASWYRESGKPELGTSEAVKAAHAANMTELKNKVPLSNQAVTAGDLANKDSSFTLGQKQTLAPFQTTDAKNTADASAFKPKQAKLNLNLTQSEIDKNEAEGAAKGANKPITPDQIVQAEATSRAQYFGQAKDFIAMRDAYSKIKGAAKNPSPAGDLSLIYSYMKILDPGSTVREGEFANAQNAGSAWDKAGALYNSVLQGTRLKSNQREDFVNQSKSLYDSQKAIIKNTQKTFQDISTRQGLNPLNVAPDLYSEDPADQPAAAAAAAPTGTGAATGGARAFKSAAEAMASGLPPGTRVTINGQEAEM